MRKIRPLWLPIFAVITFLFSFSPTIILFLATPANRIFSGINWWESDYFVYLSFVENGVRGQLQERFLMNTLTSYPAWIHGIYTVSGYFLGHLAGLNSIIIYHLDRFILGLVFIFLLTFLYLSIFKSKFWTFISLMFVFWIPGFMNTLDVSSSQIYRYLSWIQQMNIITRVTTLPHYLTSFVFYIPAVWVFVSYRKSFFKKIAFLVFLTSLFTIANPVNALIFYATIFIYLTLRFLTGVVSNFNRKMLKQIQHDNFMVRDDRLTDIKVDCAVAAVIFIANLPLMWYYHKLLSAYPWGAIGNVFGYFIGNNQIPTRELILALGPGAFFSLLGVLFYAGRTITKRGREENWYLFCIAWIFAQGGLYVFANKLGMEQYRFLQGLYYIPMGVLTIGGLQLAAKILTRFSSLLRLRVAPQYWVVILTFASFVATMPTLVVSYKQELYRFTDLSYFPTYYFPTVKQYEAYEYLKNNTPFATTVLALTEASAHIPAVSGNANKLDFIDKGEIQKAEFFANNLNNGRASEYLKQNNISYVWVGFEEVSLGFDPKRYTLLTPIFKNDEVEIYKVN